MGPVTLRTDEMSLGTAPLIPKFAKVDCASNGDNTLVAAVAGKRIRVLAGVLVAAGTVVAAFQSGASGTALTGAMSLVASSGFTVPFCPLGNFQTAAGVLLNLSLDGSVQVSGWLVYIEV